jgi:catechol 2,3-dioxygenase-like lactoylglutathione lyase family enzyme
MEDGPMVDRATPNLPSRDLNATARFYARLGFEEKFHDDGWMILQRGTLELEFFPYPRLDPRANIASCCLRIGDARALHAAFASADLPSSPRATPRLTSPVDQPWGFREFALVDPDCNLLRCLESLGTRD